MCWHGHWPVQAYPKKPGVDGRQVSPGSTNAGDWRVGSAGNVALRQTAVQAAAQPKSRSHLLSSMDSPSQTTHVIPRGFLWPLFDWRWLGTMHTGIFVKARSHMIRLAKGN